MNLLKTFNNNIAGKLTEQITIHE